MLKRWIFCGLFLLLALPAWGQDLPLPYDPLTHDPVTDSVTAYQFALWEIKQERIDRGELFGLCCIWLKTLPPEIGQLTDLRKVTLIDMPLSSLPPEIGLLTNLQELNLNNTRLTGLPPEIGHLANLSMLNLDNSPLTRLPPEIGRLRELRSLSLSATQITELPVELGQLPNLIQLSLYNTPLTFPPPEIVQQGTPAILAYLRDYQAMMLCQTIAGIAAGVGGIAVLMLGFRWRQRRGLRREKKKR